MKTLNFYQSTELNGLAHPKKHAELSLSSSALNFLQDFEQVEPPVLDTHVSALEAKQIMLNTHISVQLVFDRDGSFAGVVSSDDLNDWNIVKKVSEGNARDEIDVADLMTPKHELKVLHYSDVANASIADVIDRLKDSGETVGLVISENSHSIRGVFSTQDISQKLDIPIEPRDKHHFYNTLASLA